jgi:hypothetical protein
VPVARARRRQRNGGTEEPHRKSSAHTCVHFPGVKRHMDLRGH